MQYVIYHQGLDSHPLYVSACELFMRLGLELCKKQKFADCGGYYARFFQKDVLLKNVAYNLALANELNATLVFLDEDSYANALWAKNILESDNDLLREVEANYLHNFQLLYNSRVQVSHLPDLLNSLEFGVKKYFNEFSAALVRGAFQGHLPKSTNHRIYDQISLRVVNTSLSNQYYAHLVDIDSYHAYYLNAKLLFDLTDLGVDFIITYSSSQFDMLDSKRNELCKAYRRDNVDIPILFLPQVLLLAIGESNSKKLGFDMHAQKVEIG